MTKELLRRLKNLQIINAIISVPPVEPPPKNVIAQPAPTHVPPNKADKIIPTC